MYTVSIPCILQSRWQPVLACSILYLILARVYFSYPNVSSVHTASDASKGRRERGAVYARMRLSRDGGARGRQC
jgi:hypothetical protein